MSGADDILDDAPTGIWSRPTPKVGQVDRAFARAVAKELAVALREHGMMVPTGHPSRQTLEESAWRDRREERAFSDPTSSPPEGDGTSSWSERKAAELIVTSRRREKRKR